MQHYFIDKQHTPADYFEFKDSVLGLELCFRSCDSIFSKNKIDDGTRSLLNAIQKQETLSGYGLDLGCGLGVIGITLAKQFGVKMLLTDVNNTAVNLSNQNLTKNNVKNATAIYSDGFNQIEDEFNFIVTNPPIKTGKTLLFKLMDGAFAHLKQGGKLLLVIRKDHGMQSLKTYLQSVFGNCEIIDRNKGYYILKCVKE